MGRYYDAMFEAISTQYENGEITFEQADELNELAAKKERELAYKVKKLGTATGEGVEKVKGKIYNKFTGGYSKEEEDAFLDEYEQRINEVKEDIKAFREMDKDSLTVAAVKNAFKKIMTSLDNVEEMLKPANMPKSMSNAAIKKSPKFGRMITGTILGSGIMATTIAIPTIMSVKNDKKSLYQSHITDEEAIKKRVAAMRKTTTDAMKLGAAATAVVAGSNILHIVKDVAPSPEKAEFFRKQQKTVITEIKAKVAELEVISLK